MTQRKGGTKRSSQLAFRRRLLIVRLLLRGSASSDALIAAVQRELGNQGYPPAAIAALKHDLDALKAEYGCRITFRRETGGYVLEDLGELALLDLSDAAMEALAFLDASFPPGTALPELVNVRTLLDQVIRLLPGSRREQHQHRHTATRLSIPDQGSGRIDSTVLNTVKRAIDERRELSFQYLSSFDASTPRRHRVAPYNIFFRSEGHVYLDATLLEVQPIGGETLHAAIDYRLDRMVPGTVQVLPRVLPYERLHPKRYILRYLLLPVVARRRDVAVYFPDTHIQYHDDESATVTAAVTNLWQARQILLRYGTACRVIEPPELVALFRTTVQGLADIYENKEATSESTAVSDK
jgi:predicted DNA-binding transcriptional regulator YafY